MAKTIDNVTRADVRSDESRDAAAEVAERIHLEMWRKRVSQQTMADALGLNQSTLSKKLRNHVPITIPELISIGRVLEVDPAELLPRLDSNQQPSGYLSSLVSEPQPGELVELETFRRSRRPLRVVL